MRQAEIQPTLPKFLFSSCKGTPEHNLGTRNCPPPKTSMTSNAASPPPPHQADLDEFSDDPLNYSDFILEGTKNPILYFKMLANVVLVKDFDDIQSRNKGPVTATAVPAALPISSKVKKTISRGNSSVTSEPVQLENGKWACNHRCKDKTA